MNNLIKRFDLGFWDFVYFCAVVVFTGSNLTGQYVRAAVWFVALVLLSILRELQLIRRSVYGKVETWASEEHPKNGSDDAR